MEFALDKSSELSYYDQIKHQLTAALHMGGLKTKETLPTVRALARSLGVNPKTALKIYHRLHEEGLIEIKAGSGVRVSAIERKTFEQSYLASLVSMVERHLEEAQRMRFSPSRYLQLLQELLHPGKRRETSCVMLECNTEQIRLFAGEIQSHLGITAHPLLISDLHAMNRATLSLLHRASFFITTDFHWDEVVRLAKQFHRTPLKIRLNPEFITTLIQCARKGGILMVVSNLDFIPNFRIALRDLGYQSILNRIHTVLVSDERRLHAVAAQVKHVYLSPLVDPRILRQLPAHVRRMPFSQHLSPESLNSLRSSVLIHFLRHVVPPASVAARDRAAAPRLEQSL